HQAEPSVYGLPDAVWMARATLLARLQETVVEVVHSAEAMALARHRTLIDGDFVALLVPTPDHIVAMRRAVYRQLVAASSLD
ncbi:hypothetical protein ABTN25_20325, partial [Acinetobacter baumannii]